MTACSRDGTVRLWDCGEATCLSVVSKSDCPVNSCALTELHGMENTTDNQTSKILFLTIQDNNSRTSLIHCAISFSSFENHAFEGTAESILM